MPSRPRAWRPSPSPTRTGRSTGCRRSRRSCSSPSGRAEVRFQDAARDARAVVYAGIQADPVVARAATLLAGASLPERLMARAVMNGDGSQPGPWRRMFPAVFGGDAGTTREHAGEL